jgi:hypothetical protein
MNKEVTGIVILMAVSVLIGGGLGKLVSNEHAKTMTREQARVTSCTAKGGTFLVSELKCLAAKEIK